MDEEAIWAVLKGVPDPEIPVVSVVDLGIVREVAPDKVRITTTYSGCPATSVIQQTIREALDAAGFGDVAIETVLSPPWTTDWISEDGRRKLEAYGIAPPAENAGGPSVFDRLLRKPLTIACPRCKSENTSRISEFGSTPCKAQYRCDACLEPFDYFKCI